jgi:uroporphyrinogen decarboxylase
VTSPAANRVPGEEPLFLRACRRDRVERTPVWFMRQAGRYLPEYRELRAKVDFLTSCRTPEVACELTLQPIRRLGVDAAILFSDILIPLPGMGVPVAFNPGPVIDDPVRSRSAIERLRVSDAREATPFVLDAVRLLRRELPTQVPLIGFAGSPFTVATYLVEGGGSKSFAEIKTLLFAEPELAHLLLAKCADTIASYLVEQVRAGAQAAMLFDTWAGILSPGDYAAFALPYARLVFEAVGRAGGDVPRIYYAGESAGWLEAAAGVGANVIGIDWRMSLADARRRLGSSFAVQGNLDPGVLLGSKSLIEARTREVLSQAAAGTDGGGGASPGHIFNLGHGILPPTPPENALFLVETVHRLTSESSRS